MYVSVITGASKGLGEEFARQLAQRKHNLVLVARSETRLKELAEELERDKGVRVLYCPEDLSKEGAAHRINDFLKKEGVHAQVLINNAGYGIPGILDSQNSEDVRGMMMVNMVALVELTHLLLPSIRLHKDARIINVASTAAFQPVPYFNVYSATKTFVLNFSEALSEELSDTDVRVLALCPGPTPTNFHEAGGIDAKVFDQGQSPADVVQMGLRASDRGKVICVCQKKHLILALRFMPRFVVRKAAAFMAKKMFFKGDS